MWIEFDEAIAKMNLKKKTVKANDVTWVWSIKQKKNTSRLRMQVRSASAEEALLVLVKMKTYTAFDMCVLFYFPPRGIQLDV